MTEESLEAQLARQTARIEVLLRQAASQATALSVLRCLSEALARPADATPVFADVLLHCLEADGFSMGLFYVLGKDGAHRAQARFGIPDGARAEDAENAFGRSALLRQTAVSGQPAAFTVGAKEWDGEVPGLLAQLGQKSILVVPFVVLEQSFGQVVLGSDRYDLTETPWLAFARSLALQFSQTVALARSLARIGASEGRYHALMEQANDAILILDRGHRVLEANVRAEELLGRPRADIVGREYHVFVAPDEQADVLQRREQLLTDGTLRVASRQLVQADGTRIAADVSSSLVWFGDESVTLTTLRDITERVRDQDALRRSEARMKSVLDGALDAVIMMDAQGSVTFWNRRAEALFGWSTEEASRRLLSDLIVPPRYREAHARGLERFLTTGDGPILGRRMELFAVRRDGTELPVELTVTALGQSDGFFFSAFVSDITERKRAEQMLLRSEEQYHVLFDSSPHPMYVFDDETLAVLNVNEAALHHYGYSRAEFLALRITDVAVPRGADVTFQSLGLSEHRKKDGTLMQMEVSANEVSLSGRKAWLGLAVDVTEKRNLEAQLLQSQKMESLGRLAGGVAHDFNNILGVITGYGELLRRRVSEDARSAKYAEDILKAAERAAGLTRQLLAFSRKDASERRVLDLNVVVRELEGMLRRLLGEDIALATTFDEQAGPVKADPGQIAQVLMNLAVNARDAMPRGGRLAIQTASVVVDEAPYVALSVSDTGHGMTHEVRARVFEPFFTTKGPGEGTGLGLATVHAIVKESAGRIQLDSEPGRGTTFRICLPCTSDATAQIEPSSPAEVEPARAAATVLLVEDEESLREIIRECLEAAGYHVLDAGQGAEALATCEGHGGTIDLLLTDVVLPEMGGRDLAARMQALRPALRTIYMSGYTDEVVIHHDVLPADVAFLQKPFSAETLARKVREVLDAA